MGAPCYRTLGDEFIVHAGEALKADSAKCGGIRYVQTTLRRTNYVNCRVSPFGLRQTAGSTRFSRLLDAAADCSRD